MLNAGDKLPKFKLPNAQGQEFSDSDLKGSWAVIYFYPKDNTPGCTIEANDFTKLLPEFKKLKAKVFGVSKDSKESHCKFINKRDLTIELLSDESLEMQKAFGVWRPKKFMGREFLGTVRSTFLISPDCKIAYVWDTVKAKGHANAVLKQLTELAKK